MLRRRVSARWLHFEVGRVLRMLQKLCDAFLIQNLCQMRSQFGRSLCDDGAGRHVLEAQLDVSEADDVAALELGALDADAVDEDAVGAALIPDDPDVLFALKKRVTSRDAGVGKRDFVGGGSADVNGGAIFQLVKPRLDAGTFDD